MHWALAIERHRQPLLRIVATLYAMIGLADGGSIARLSRPLYRAVLAVLRPAEAAVRRLIVVAARGLVVKPRAVRPLPAGRVIARKGQGRSSFQLFDPRVPDDAGHGRRSARGCEPRIRLLGADFDPRIPLFRQPAPPLSQLVSIPDGSVNAVPLCRRLAAIRRALKDLSGQARRYARWQAKALAARRPQRDTVLRRGPPPGLRPKSSHEVHEILRECHWLARSLPVPDTG